VSYRAVSLSPQLFHLLLVLVNFDSLLTFPLNVTIISHDIFPIPPRPRFRTHGFAHGTALAMLSRHFMWFSAICYFVIHEIPILS
jgi:hypothetical protein